MTIGEKIAAKRKASGLLAKDLAAGAGMSRVGLWKIETGRSQPKIETLTALAKALGCRTSKLLP